MHTLRVELGTRSYPIYIGEDLLADTSLLQKHVRGRQVMIVTNERLASLYLDPVKNAFKGYQCDTIALPDGEQYKTLETLSKIFDALIERHHHRNTTLIALGGGVIGDMTGFAAACYQRGVNFIQIPTSLLAQVDASVGGKTGVNHPQGKNMIGAFYQPQCVIIDINTLKTLPDRELSGGLAEVIKAALIQDAYFFSWLEQNMPQLLAKEPDALVYAIQQSCAIKADIVAADEKESNKRALLNLGHTFGHAIEQLLGYGAWLHGEAVAVGIVLAAELSARLGWLKKKEVERIRKILIAARLPIQLPPDIQYPAIRNAMMVDKKIVETNLRFVLLKAIGQGILTSDVTDELLQEVLQQNTRAFSMPS